MTNPNQAARTELLYFDDLRVGQRFPSGARLIDEGQIRAFDPQPFHLDAEAAKDALPRRTGCPYAGARHETGCRRDFTTVPSAAGAGAEVPEGLHLGKIG